VFVSLVVARFTQQEKIAALEDESALLTGKDNKKERAAKGTLGLDDHMWETSMEDEVDRKEIADLKSQQRYVDACKIGKGL
ncbi:unnamed protein product, partial [Durusdinium trenchii]